VSSYWNPKVMGPLSGVAAAVGALTGTDWDIGIALTAGVLTGAIVFGWMWITARIFKGDF
jgi:hypothetical protein